MRLGLFGLAIYQLLMGYLTLGFYTNTLYKIILSQVTILIKFVCMQMI